MLQITNLRNPAVRIQKSRTALLLDHPFFGSLLFRLGRRSSTSIQTLATYGVSLYYNPNYVETLSAAELAGVLAHEVMHPALQHHTRRGGRNPKRRNMACDYAINPLLIDAGLALPKDVFIDHRFRGMSAEQTYNLIEEQETELSQETVPADHAPKGDSSDQQASSNDDGSQMDAPVTPGELARCWMPQSRREMNVLRSPNRQGNGRLPLSRQKASHDSPGNCPPVFLAVSKNQMPLESIGANCCVEHGQTQFHRTTAGSDQTGAMFGLGCFCQGSSPKVPARLPLRSIAPDP